MAAFFLSCDQFFQYASRQIRRHLLQIDGAVRRVAVGEVGDRAHHHKRHARGYLATGVDHLNPTVFHSDPELVEAFRKAAEAVIEPSRVKTGRIASGDQFISEPAVKRDIAGYFGAAAAEMEGCAIAQVAEYAGVPFVVVRAISDLADGDAADSSVDLEEMAADLSGSILEKLIAG